MDGSSIEELKKCLIEHEGSSSFAYEDSLGFITIGIGRCIDRRRSKGLSYKEQLYLLDNDIEECKSTLEPYVWYQQLDDVRKCVMIELCFNLGVRGLLGFKKTIEALKVKSFVIASSELRDSKWAKQISKDRVENICYRLKNGSYPVR